MGAKDSEKRSAQQSSMQEEHGATDQEKEARAVWAHMQDEGQEAGEGGDVWNDGGRDEESKTRLDDMKEWCGEEIHTLNRKAQDRSTWRTVVKMALDNYRRQVHGAMDG